MRNIIYSALGFIIIAIILFKTILTPHLITTAKTLTNMIVEQEIKTDCTCWSTVRVMEFHQAKMPLTYSAMVFKIESMKTLMWQIWQTASNDEAFEDNLKKILGPNYSAWTTTPDSSFSIFSTLDNIKLQQYHYHKLTEHYRYLLSIIYDASAMNVPVKRLKELSKHEIKKLAVISTHLTTQLLEDSQQFAIKKNRSKINDHDIKASYQKIKESLNLESQPLGTTPPSSLFRFWLNKLNKKIITNKIKTLKKVNQSIWNNNNHHPHEVLSKITNTKISDHEINLLIEKFIDEFMYLFFETPTIRIDSMRNSSFNAIKNSTAFNKEDSKNKIIRFINFSNKIAFSFPYILHENSDLNIYYMMQDELPHHLPLETDIFKSKALHQTTLKHYMLDAIRDSAIHWATIETALKKYRISIMDPFALEILAERISEYYGFIFNIMIEKNIRLFEVLKMNLSNIQFIQNEAEETPWKKPTILPPTSYFKEDFNDDLKLPAFEDSMDVKLKIFNAGISVVDINNDNQIDILTISNKQLLLYENNKGNFKKHMIIENINDHITSVIAIDRNFDNEKDLILLGHKGIYEYQKTPQKLTFKQTKMTELPYAFSICVGDLINDDHLEFFIGRVNNVSFNLAGNNALPNQLLNHHLQPIPSSFESTQWALACSIADIDLNGKNDLLTVNDISEDELFLQSMDGTFNNQATKWKVNDNGSGMNSSIVDLNNDGYWDHYITVIHMMNRQLTFQMPSSESLVNLNEKLLNTSTYLVGNQLYINKKDSFEKDNNQIIEPTINGWGWGAVFFDYNNNGFNDLYVTNGIPTDLYISNMEKNIFYLNIQNKLMHTRSTSAESFPQKSRAAIAADIDNDGKLDLIVKNTQNLKIFKNMSNNSNQWLKIKCIGKKENPHAIGATIMVETTTKKQYQLITGSTGFLSQAPYIKHFGLKNEPLKKIKITWPNKEETILTAPIASNQIITISQP